MIYASGVPSHLTCDEPVLAFFLAYEFLNETRLAPGLFDPTQLLPCEITLLWKLRRAFENSEELAIVNLNTSRILVVRPEIVYGADALLHERIRSFEDTLPKFWSGYAEWLTCVED